MTAWWRGRDHILSLSPASLAARSPHPPLDLNCNNEIAFHSDGAAGGL